MNAVIQGQPALARYCLVGYDGSDSSQRAFRFALDLTRARGGRVRVVTAVKVAEGVADTCAIVMADRGRQRAAELLGELTLLEPGAADLIDVEVTCGSPGNVLLQQVRQHNIDHIVIGHTERGTLARWLLGSVSAEVLAGALVPVTVVR